MTSHESTAGQLPCATSTLHQPEEVDGIFNAERFSSVAGGCASAAEAISVLGLPNAMIQNCPKLLEDYKAKGAPQSATCIAELMLFASATMD